MVDLAALQSEEGVEIVPGVRVRLRSLADYRQNPENPVAHSPRNLSTIVESIQKVGAARSGLAADGTIYAGNLTSEAMAIAGIEGIVEVTTDGTKWVMVNRPDLTPEQRKQAAHGDQWSAMLAEMNVDQLLADIEARVDLEGIYSEFDLEAILGEALVEVGTGEHKITRKGRLYDHDIEPYKLAYRIEAAWRADGGLALDLFSGSGQLAEWYRRRFKRVVTVDKNADFEADYTMTAMSFISEHLSDYLDFDFVDFDDEGTPAHEIAVFFEAIQGKKEKPFMLALTDGNGMNLKFRGKFDTNIYLMDEGLRQATREDYDGFEVIVTDFVTKCAEQSGFAAKQLSTYRGREGNVVYQTWLIDIAPNPA